MESKECLSCGGFLVFGGKSLRELNNVCGEVGGVEKMSSTGSKFMVRGRECLEGCVGACGGEVSEGGDDFRVRKSLLCEIPGVATGESDGESFGVDGGTVWLSVRGTKLTKKNELEAKSTLLLAIPDEHLLKFHSIKDAKCLWEAITIRFRGNKESKKMHKTILKQQYENFVASRSEGLDKTYDRFQKLISQLELNGEVISQEDANMKLLRSLPPAWNNISLIMRNKPDIETLSIDDMYNNLKVYETEIKGQSSSGSNSHNVAFVSSENTTGINETVIATHDIHVAGSKEQPSASSYVDDRTRRNLNSNGNEPVSFVKTRVECYNFHRRGHFARECRAPRNQGNRSGDNKRRVVPVETHASALVVQDRLTGIGYNSQLSENEMPKCKIFKATSDSSVSEIDEDNNQAKVRYKVGIWYHVVPPPYTGNYMPPKANLSFAGLDDSVFKYKISETITSLNENKSIACKSSEEIREEPKTVRHMMGNKSFLTEYKEIDGGFVAFGGSPKGGNQSNGDACIQSDIHARKVSQEKATVHEYILLPLIPSNPQLSSTIQSLDVNAGDQPRDVNASDKPRDVNAGDIQGDVDKISGNDDVYQGNKIRIDSSTHVVNAASLSINTDSNIIAAGSLNINTADSNHTNILTLEVTGIFDGAFDDRDLGAEADTNNLDSSIVFNPILTTIVHKDHPKEHII
uniref:Ribonuclease H-like domain-containing protein n=1 Tax=Tanacetum cinerariifolium TaxID=118510 RepID=A0A6L2LCX6_TANCI|nr:ribonuclease H-like domain-containing protein [Tanacetum cinerariifolium]